MTESPPRQADAAPPRAFRLALLTASAILATATAAVFAARLDSTLRHGDLYITSGGEGAVIYSIWKAQNGLPVYELYGDDSLTGSFYNFLFYRAYASVLSLLGIGGERLVLGGRMLTLAICAAGAGLTYALMRRLAGPPHAAWSSAFLAVMATVCWFGTAAMSWWALIVRSDAAALALAVGGLSVYTAAARRRSPALLAAASLIFYASWAFKQSFVGILIGVSLHALATDRDPRRWAALIAPAFVLMVATLYFGGEAYRFNVVTLCAGPPRDARTAVSLMTQAVLAHAFVWAFLAAALVVALRRGWLDMGLLRGELGPAIFACVATLGWAAFTTGRIGSSKNHLLEMSTVGAALASALLVRAARTPGLLPGWAGGAVVMLVLSMAALPVTQLRYPKRFGAIRLATDAQHAAKARLASAMHDLPKPLFARDEMLGLPWHSSEGRYPAYALDVMVYDRPRLAAMIARHHFRTLVMSPDDLLYGAALEAGYAAIPGVADGGEIPERALRSPGPAGVAATGTAAGAGGRP